MATIKHYGNRKSNAADQSLSVLMTSSDLEKRNANLQSFLRISVNVLVQLDLVGKMIHVGEGVFLQSRSIPQILGTFYVHVRNMRNSHILHGDQTRCEENFYMVN